MFNIFQKETKTLTNDELKIIDLLLQGDNEILSKLRQQLQPPLFMEIRRRSPSTKPKVYNTPPNEYHIDIVFDERFEKKFSIGSKVSLEIDDLQIFDQNLNQELKVIGVVNKGIFTNIRFVSNKPIKWPKSIKLTTWKFNGNNKTSQERISFEKLSQIKVEKESKIDDLKISWVKELFKKLSRKKVFFALQSPVENMLILSLEEKFGGNLPEDFKEFFMSTNGATILGANIFDCDELYLLEETRLSSDKLLVFLIDQYGSPLVINLSKCKNKHCHIEYFDGELNQFITLANSFKEWLTKFIETATE